MHVRHPRRAPAAPGSSVLRVDDLRVRYGGIEAVRGVSFDVGPGELVTLLGANGAGKSSTLKALARLLPIASGEVRLLGEPVASIGPDGVVARGLSLVPEGRAIVAGMTVEETLRLGAYSHRDDAALAESLSDVYEMFPRLDERRKQDAATLSGGEQQMLALGRALCARPALLMLDEPSLGLAPKVVHRIFEAIVAIAAAGIAVLLVEQNTRLALTVARRGYVLRRGEIVLEGSAERLRDAPEMHAAYLGG